MRRALILAAGLGERLRPLTLKVPKCLLPICGRPLLEIWMQAFRRAGVEEVLVNTHHLAAQVEAFLGSWRWRPAAVSVHEPDLLGSAGTLACNRGFFEGPDPFAIVYADTYAPDIDLDAVFRFHERRRPLLTACLFHAPVPSECGIVELSDEGRILAFQEKPARPSSDLASAGVFVAEPSLLDRLPRRLPADLGFDVLPALAEEMFGLMLHGPVLDIGTPGRYRQAQEIGRSMDAAAAAPRVNPRPRADTQGAAG